MVLDPRLWGLKCSDMGQSFLKFDMCIEENKRQRRATMPFLKNRHATLGTPIKGPLSGISVYIHKNNQQTVYVQLPGRRM